MIMNGNKIDNKIDNNSNMILMMIIMIIMVFAQKSRPTSLFTITVAICMNFVCGESRTFSGLLSSCSTGYT